MFHKIKSRSKIAKIKRNIDTNIFVCFKNRKSMKANRKKTAKDTKIQIICLLKNSPPLSWGAKLFIVTSPDKIIGNIKRTKSQSILLRAFWAIPLFQLYSENVIHWN